MSSPALPPRAVAEHLNADLAPMRARLLRRVGIAHRGPVLDLGAGWGLVTRELERRARGPVVALDRDPEAIAALGPEAVRGDACDLPFDAEHFDLVVCQQVLLWVGDLDRALSEIRRVLRPGGVLVALEPDYGGMIEHPAVIAIGSLWRAALSHAGADPEVGRKLPAAASRAGLDPRCDLLPHPSAIDHRRFDLLEGLSLGPDERARLEGARCAQAELSPASVFVHLPFVCITAAAS
jgi:SAM-dependent methyltransferase